MQQQFTVKEFKGEQAFHDLRPDWDALWRESADATHFQLWDWQHLFWKHVAPDAVPYFATLWDSAGRCRTIAALIRTRDPKSGMMVTGFIGSMRSDYNMFLVGKDVPESAGLMLLRHLLKYHRHRSSSLKLINVPAESWTGKVVSAYRAECAVDDRLIGFMYGEGHTVLLPSSIDEYVSTLSQRARRHFGYERRRLEKGCKIEFRVHEGINGIEEIIDQIEVIDLSRWKSESMYSRPQRQALEKGVIRALAERGNLLVFLLYINGKPATFAWCALVRGIVEVDRIAYDPSLPSKLSVGKVANFYAIEECIRRGHTEFDLTRGGEAYKGWLGAVPRKLINFEIHRSQFDRLFQKWGAKFGAVVRKQEWMRTAYRKYVSG